MSTDTPSGRFGNITNAVSTAYSKASGRLKEGMDKKKKGTLMDIIGNAKKVATGIGSPLGALNMYPVLKRGGAAVSSFAKDFTRKRADKREEKMKLDREASLANFKDWDGEPEVKKTFSPIASVKGLVEGVIAKRKSKKEGEQNLENKIIELAQAEFKKKYGTAWQMSDRKYHLQNRMLAHPGDKGSDYEEMRAKYKKLLTEPKG